MLQDAHSLCLEVSGHALTQRAGEDLLCCAVSTLTQAWVEGVRSLLGEIEEATQKNGYLFARARFSAESWLLFRFIGLGLEGLACQYPDHLSLKTQRMED